MSVAVTINGTSYTAPAKGDTGWAATTSSLLQALCGVAAGVYQFGGASGLAAGAARYLAPGMIAASTTEYVFRTPIGGKLSKLYAVATSAVSGDSCVIRVRTSSNGTQANSALTCTIAASGTTASDTSNTVTVAAGDYISVSATAGAGYSSGGANLDVRFLFTPS